MAFCESLKSSQVGVCRRIKKCLLPRYLSCRENKWSAIFSIFWEDFTRILQFLQCCELFCIKYKQNCFTSIADMKLFTALFLYPQLIPYSWSDGGGWRKCGLSSDRLIPDYRTILSLRFAARTVRGETVNIAKSKFWETDCLHFVSHILSYGGWLGK